MNNNEHPKLINPNTKDNIPKFFVSDFPPYEVIYVKTTVLLSV